MVLFQCRHDSPPDGTRRTGLVIMMAVLALIAAELLVSPAIVYLVPALQTSGSASGSPLRIIHTTSFL